MVADSQSGARLDELAKTLLDVVPLVVRTIRGEMRAHRNAELTVAQFRVLSFVEAQGNASLSSIAEHLGLTLPSASTLVEGLVVRGLVDRASDPSDRRKVSIEVTPKGHEAWSSAWKATRAAMVRRLEALSERKRLELSGALEALRALFAAPAGSPRTAVRASGGGE